MLRLLVKFIDLTLPSAEQNLAFDEALLFQLEQGQIEGEILRVWELPSLCVVLGISGLSDQELYLDRCKELDVPVYRRCSGGGTVVLGPGCLNYSLLLSFEKRPSCLDLTRSYKEILGVIASALGRSVSMAGTCDLMQESYKISGNAQRRLQHSFLHHGTVLYNFDQTVMRRLLKEPTKQPEYRKNRDHLDFVRNISLSSREIKLRLKEAFHASGKWTEEAPDLSLLLREKYANPEWIFRC
jgi:lipoate---protein ligase